MTAKDGGPAFPRSAFAPEGVRSEDCCITDAQDGMSLRDYFAGQALAGFISGGAIGHITGDLDQSNATAEKTIAFSAYRFADAMVAARDK